MAFFFTYIFYLDHLPSHLNVWELVRVRTFGCRDFPAALVAREQQRAVLYMIFTWTTYAIDMHYKNVIDMHHICVCMYVYLGD